MTLDEQSTLEREYRALRAIPDNFPKLMVSLDEYQLPDNEGIKHLQAWKFEDYLKLLDSSESGIVAAPI